jgi:hypothetical protein
MVIQSDWPHPLIGPMADSLTAVRYRGFVLISQLDLSWLVRPEPSR